MLVVSRQKNKRMAKDATPTTHFGYETVPLKDKAHRIKGVFDSVANRYDVMNDLMSGGLHRLWKHFTIEQATVRRGQTVLDLAGGTGDLTKVLAGKVGDRGHVVLADINANMLRTGRSRLIDAGVAGNLSIVQIDAEKLPFTSNSFDCITIAFGLRNVTNKDTALASMLRGLKPGGKVLILEFSKPIDAIKSIYDFYSFKVIPLQGKLVANDESSYRYLAESIQMHPGQDEFLQMMKETGFERCRYHNLSGGIVALHIGYRL